MGSSKSKSKSATGGKVTPILSKNLQTKEYEYKFKIVLNGNLGVGKTSLVQRFIDGTFDDVSTVGAEYKSKSITVADGSRVMLEIWDTAGQERFRTLTTPFYQGSHAVILCYDISQRESFTDLEKHLAELERYTNDKVVRYVAGLKSDLDQARAVSPHEVADFLAQHGLDHLDTSSKAPENVDLLFETVAALIRKRVA